MRASLRLVAEMAVAPPTDLSHSRDDGPLRVDGEMEGLKQDEEPNLPSKRPVGGRGAVGWPSGQYVPSAANHPHTPMHVLGSDQGASRHPWQTRLKKG